MKSLRIPARILGVTLCALLALPAISTSALSRPVAKPSASDPRINKLKDDLEYVSKQEAKEIKKYLKLKAERKTADAKLATLDSKIRAAEARRRSAQAQAASARSEYASSQSKLDKAVSKSKEADERRSKAIVRLYQESSDPDAEPSVLSAEPEDRPNIARKVIFMKKYSQKQTSVVAEAEDEADAAEQEKLQHEDARRRAEAAEDLAQEEADALVPLRAELVEAQKDAKAKEAEEDQIIDSLQSKKSAYDRQINELVAESNALAAAIKRKQSSSTVVSPGKMMRPVSAPITSSFGMRIHPIYGTAKLHAGVDFGAKSGTAIKAAKPGKVIFASTMNGYGNVIIIDHGSGISTLYAHQSRFAVGLGATVKQGQVIGYVGATGQVTGPHLHWEVRVNGVPKDPMSYL